MTSVRRVLEVFLLLAVVAVGIALVSGYVLGQPAVIAYVETGSMEPTLEPGDGFVPIPSIIAGDVSEGDVVMFESETVEDGDLTTHRVVAETDQGYVTKGDANPFTDQDTGSPPITDGEIVAVALQVNGEVVRIPKIGIAAEAVGERIDRVQFWLSSALGLEILRGERGLALLLFGAGALLLIGEWAFGEQSRTRDRTRSQRRAETVDSQLVIGAVALLLMFAATLGMLAPAGVTTFELVSSESNPDTPRVVEAGGESERTYVARNGGALPVQVYVEPASDGVRIEDGSFSLSRGEERNVTVVTSAPNELGFYHRSVREYRYLSILPAGVIDGLYRVHPLAPIFAINALVGGAAVGVGFALAGGGTVRLRTAHRTRSR